MAPAIDPPAKLSIRSLEMPRLAVTAMFNPTELRIDHSVPWREAPTSHGDQPALELGSSIGRVMTFELLFDGTSTGANIQEGFLDDLFKLARVRDPNGAEDTKRPPRVGIKWGAGKLPEFQGVIESISTRYVMFLADGTPVKATCQITVRETNRVSVVVK